MISSTLRRAISAVSMRDSRLLCSGTPAGMNPTASCEAFAAWSAERDISCTDIVAFRFRHVWRAQILTKQALQVSRTRKDEIYFCRYRMSLISPGAKGGLSDQD